MLCLYHDKSDPKPQHFLSMGGEQCVGCKRDFNSDRNHSIRVMLADGTFWSIALATELDANDWIQALCQAVSEGLKVVLLYNKLGYLLRNLEINYKNLLITPPMLHCTMQNM